MLGGDQKRARSAHIQGTLRRSLEKLHLGARCPFSGPVDLFARSLDRNHTVHVANEDDAVFLACA